MAYVADVDAQSGLRLRNLVTDADDWLAFPIDFEHLNRRTRFAFTSDSEAVVFMKEGTFHEVPADYRIDGFGHHGSGNTIRTFSISTTVAVDGSVSGSFDLHARAAGVTLQGDITCATVWGAAAWLGGTVTSPGPFQGREAIFRTSTREPARRASSRIY